MAEAFPYKTPPLAPYQRDILQRTAMKPYHFLALEQGTGKSWLTINTAAALWLDNRIDAMIVLAPNGVHAAWAHDQLPTHMPDAVPRSVAVWRSSTERHAQQRSGQYSPDVTRVITAQPHRTALRILCVNTEAVGTVAAVDKVVTQMLRSGRVLLVVDEASDYSTPTAKRTRALLRWSRLASYRRCLDGTPVGKAPWDVWAMYRFLHPSVLAYAPTFRAMKDAHGEWLELQRGDTGRAFKLLKKHRDGTFMYKNVEQLTTAIAAHTSRVTKVEALPFLPPKQHDKVYFELSAMQCTLIAELRANLQTQLRSGALVTTTNVLTQYLRIQQIANGYAAPDAAWVDPSAALPDVAPEREPMEHLFASPLTDNPRLVLLRTMLAAERARNPASFTPTIVWARFRLDAFLCASVARELGLRVAVYDGSVDRVLRDSIVSDFQEGHYDVLVGNPAAGGRGLNLYRAEHVIYYSNGFGLRQRLQSEDRAHRIGTKRTVRYWDMIGVDDVANPGFSIDNIIVRALRQNKGLADLVTGDPTLSAWL
jgi:hypothetical protein